MSEDKSNDYSGWAVFGKATAWIVGLGAVGTGLYLGGKALYDAGRENVRIEQARALRNENGMEIPGTCFTLAEISNSPSHYILSAMGDCSGLQIKIPNDRDYAKTQKSLEVVLGSTKATIQNQSPYTMTERWGSGWTRVE